MRPTLTIGIPTFNRAESIGLLLASIARQDVDAIEVIVSDNASTDQTAKIVAVFRRKIARLRYLRWPKNAGMDANLMRIHAAAKGSHLWLVGSDDLLMPGAVSRVLDTIAMAPDAMILGQRKPFSIDAMMSPERFVRCPDRSRFDLDEAGAPAAYLKRAESICAAFSFLSTTIMPRASWPTETDEWDGSFYLQVYAAWYAALHGTPLIVRQIPLVQARIGNHERRNNETAAHVALDVRIFRRLARMMPSVVDAQALRRVLHHEYPAKRLASLDMRLATDASWPFIRAGLLQTIGSR